MSIGYIWSRVIKKARGSAIISSKIHRTSKIESGSQIVNCIFDRHSFCGYDCQIINSEVGAFTSIANNVIIGPATHPMRWVSMSPVFYKGRDSVKTKFAEHERESQDKTIIGNDVWIGEKVLIKQGVHIGDGAVIGMGSVVTKNVEPYSIVAGNPAKTIRKRFDNYIINELLDIRWWEYDDQTISKYSQFITKPDEFISEVNNK